MVTMGIRELRERVSAVVRMVETGETVIVTNHGRPVLRMVALSPAQGGLDRLLEEGRASSAVGELLQIPAAHLRPGTTPLSRLLAEQRSDEH